MPRIRIVDIIATRLVPDAPSISNTGSPSSPTTRSSGARDPLIPLLGIAVEVIRISVELFTRTVRILLSYISYTNRVLE